MFGPGASVNNARKNWRAFLLWPGPRSRQRRGLSLSLAASQPAGASNIRPVPKPPHVGVAGLCQSCDRTYAWPPALEQGRALRSWLRGRPSIGRLLLRISWRHRDEEADSSHCRCARIRHCHLRGGSRANTTLDDGDAAAKHTVGDCRAGKSGQHDDGRCQLEIFTGPTARRQALRYAMRKYGHFKEVQLEPYTP